MIVPPNTTLAALLLGSGLIAAVATLIGNAILSKLQSNRQGRYAALRSILTLEEFGSDCLYFVHEIDAHDAGEVWGKQHVALPKLKALPEDDEGWRALPPDLAHRFLSFPSRVRDQQRGIDFYWDNTSPDDAVDACRKACISLGCDADLFTRNARHDMKLPPRDMEWDWGSRLQRLRQERYAQNT